jgi:2-oxoglutarate ferredoxin oxidoreductase subunit alpha
MPIERVNDFVVRFANVNGSGSASANELFARSVMRMGVPVSPRNIFPSNIQGLPTWYEVRVTEAGHLGARGGVDLMVAMNPQTWDKDVASIEPGGYLFYDSTKPIPASRFRADITVIGVPLTEICNREYTDPRQRQLFKNIIYIGALSALLDMDVKEIEKLLGEQFKAKEKLIAPNIHALHLGRDYALRNLKCPLGLSVRRADKIGDRIFIEGNSASALGAVYGGATVCAWYPITPSSSLAEAFSRHCSRRTCLHGHIRPRHFADAGVPRTRLLRRDPVRHHRCATRRAFDRHADAHAAIRPLALRLCLARRHEARHADAGRPG